MVPLSSCCPGCSGGRSFSFLLTLADGGVGVEEGGAVAPLSDECSGFSGCTSSSYLEFS